MKKLLFLLMSLALFTACDPKIDELQVDKGSADFTRFVAVGNSMVAGYADGALYHSGQVNSIPNIIAGQLKLAGSGEFVQPMVTSEYGVQYPGSTPKFILGYNTDCTGKTSLGPVLSTGTMDPLGPVGYAVNNFGIPGAKSFHMHVPGYGMLNPFYTRFASSLLTSTVVQDVAAANGSFFMMWLGDNDVLSYAITGGVGDSITGQFLFQQAVGGVVQALTANGAKGVIANIPDVTSIPFFTTVPYNGLKLTQGQADSVNMAMQLYQLPFTYQAGYNPFLISDPTSPHPMFKVRQMQPGELVLLTVPQDSMKCYGMGIINPFTFMPYPIPSQYVLDAGEIAQIKTATDGYNQTLAGLAQAGGLALVDMNTKLKELKAGIVWDGIKMNATFVNGGAFSLDGIHLNPRGCAVASNYFIDAINAKYGSTIPQVDITKYQGVIFP